MTCTAGRKEHEDKNVDLKVFHYKSIIFLEMCIYDSYHKIRATEVNEYKFTLYVHY